MNKGSFCVSARMMITKVQSSGGEGVVLPRLVSGARSRDCLTLCPCLSSLRWIRRIEIRLTWLGRSARRLDSDAIFIATCTVLGRYWG